METTYVRNKIGTLVDTDGVIIKEVFEGDRIVTAEQIEYKQTHILRFRHKERL